MHVLAVITNRNETEYAESAIRRFSVESPSVRVTVFHASLEGELSDLIAEVRSLSCDAAVILTSAGQSPYSAAYLCYLAGIPVRIGRSLEFGGGVLTHWVKTLPEKDPVDRHLSLLRLIDPPSTGATPT
jgi:hypothetical protein